MAERLSLEEIFGQSGTPLQTIDTKGRSSLEEIFSGTQPTSPIPKTGIQKLGDIVKGAFTPLISEESIMANPISRGMAGAMPFTAVGGIPVPPPLGNILPPQLKERGNIEYISAETAPANILFNFLLLKGLQARKVVPKLIKFGGRKTAQKIAESADRGFDAVGKVMSNKYETLFDKIGDGVTSNAPLFESIRNVVDSFPEAAGVPKLKKIMTRLADIDTITTKELHELKQVVRKSIPKSVWSGITEADAIQNAMRDIYFNITDSLEKIGGKAYIGLSQEYRKVKEAEKLAKKMFYKSGVPSNLPMGKQMDVPTERAIKSLDTMLSPEQKFANEFLSWRRKEKLKNLGIRIGTLGILGRRY